MVEIVRTNLKIDIDRVNKSRSGMRAILNIFIYNNLRFNFNIFHNKESCKDVTLPLKI